MSSVAGCTKDIRRGFTHCMYSEPSTCITQSTTPSPPPPPPPILAPHSSAGLLLVASISSLAEVLGHEVGYARYIFCDLSEMRPEFIPDALRIILLLLVRHGLAIEPGTGSEQPRHPRAQGPLKFLWHDFRSWTSSALGTTPTRKQLTCTRYLMLPFARLK